MDPPPKGTGDPSVTNLSQPLAGCDTRTPAMGGWSNPNIGRLGGPGENLTTFLSVLTTVPDPD